jgi:hypothetical protein
MRVRLRGKLQPIFAPCMPYVLKKGTSDLQVNCTYITKIFYSLHR